MRSLGSSFNFSRYTDREQLKKRNKAPHSKAALVDEIKKDIAFVSPYTYTYWLRQVKVLEDKGGGPPQILEWLRIMRDYPPNFNRGAILTNKIKRYGANRRAQESDSNIDGTVPSKEG